MTNPEPVARDEFFDSLLGDFLDESGQLLDRLNENLLQLDEWVRGLDQDHTQRCDDELMNDMFRAAHSLKGLSAMLGLGDINHLTHKVENVFDAARKDELIIRGDTVELMFQAVDRLVSLVETLKDPDAEPVECEPVIENIGRLLQAAGVDRAQTSQKDAERTLQEQMAEAQARQTAAHDSHPVVLSGETESAHPAEEPRAEEPRAQEPQAEGPQAQASQVGQSPAPPNPPSADVPPAVQPSVKMVQPTVDCFQGIEDECDGRSKYMGIFIDETELSLDQLTETLMALEGLGGAEATQSLLVIAHRIKGSAASIGLNRVAKLAHLMEDLLQRLVDTGQMLSPSVTDAMLMCSDALRQYVEGLKLGNRPPDQFNRLAQELHAAQESQGPATPRQVSPPPTVSGPARPAPALRAPLADMTLDSIRQMVEDRCGDQQHTFVGMVQFEPNLPLAGLKGRLLYEKLANLGKVCYFDPPPEALDELEDLGGVSFGLVAERPLGAISRPLRIAGVQQAIVEPLWQEEADSSAAKEPSCEGPTTRREAPAQEQVAPEQHAPEVAQGGPQAKNRPAESGNKPTETLRVDIERLDQLMNLAGELVISKARFSRISDSLRSALASRQSSQVLHNALALLDRMASGDGKSSEGRNLQAELDSLRGLARRIQNDLESVRRDVEVLGQVRTTVNDLVETIHQLDRVADGIQQSVMDTRMLPIGPLFTRFKRVIRDITRGNGKSIRLVINGEKTELDKRMIDELGDPLIHMVRNSADHGIELPEVREALGKPREGTVTLDAFHRGNSIVIRVSDDGKGLDPDRIRRKALEKGLATEADLDKMTRHQIYQLIWEPGLSTAEKVTEVSGRGMGMDIVKSKIEDLNGVVDLESEPGKGTTLTIKLPLTLAILPSLMVEIDGDVFAMPLESVVEIVGVHPRDLATVHGQWTARVRGRVISTVMLGDVFSWTQGTDRARQEDSQETTLVIIGETGREIGLAVDKVLGEEDVVIKSMAENYRNVAGIAGASILGDGRVSLILDLAALIDMSANRSKPVTAC